MKSDSKPIDPKELVELIKSRGYWEVDIRPDEPSRNRFESISDCFNKVRESVVSLRGWDYPHHGPEPPPYAMNKRIESVENWADHKEYWTMFLNGHFYHLFGCIEDWQAEDISIFGRTKYHDISPMTVLDFLNALYSVTEIYEFSIRLAQKNILGRRVRIKITLFGTKERKIFSFDSRRFIPRDFMCREESISFDKSMSIEELIGRGHEIALETTIGILEVFNWLNPSREMLREEQRKFLERRI
jgi:hypothetical protein